MPQWLGLDPLAAFTLRRLEAGGWSVSVHFVNEVVEMHAVRQSDVHVARCNDGIGPLEQRRAVALLATAAGITGVLGLSPS